MTRAFQKRHELAFLDLFLRGHLKLADVEIGKTFKETPDGSATINNPDGTTSILDFELVEYFVDEPVRGSGGAPSKKAAGCWRKVQKAIYSRLKLLRLSIDLLIRFKEPMVLKSSQTNQLADEMIRFAQEFCPRGYLSQSEHKQFSATTYPLLHQSVGRIDLSNHEGLEISHWQCENISVASIGVVIPILIKHVEEKNAKSFNWSKDAEKCLLIYASGESTQSGAGPDPPDPRIWNDAGLVDICNSSQFNRIYFWEKVRRWDHRLK